MFSLRSPDDQARCTFPNSLQTTELGLGSSRQKSIAHIKSGCNEGVQQLLGGWLGEEGTDTADVAKMEVGGRAHSANMGTHAHAAVLCYAKVLHSGGWDNGNIRKRDVHHINLPQLMRQAFKAFKFLRLQLHGNKPREREIVVLVWPIIITVSTLTVYERVYQAV